jgi:hypothetical protein
VWSYDCIDDLSLCLTAGLTIASLQRASAAQHVSGPAAAMRAAEAAAARELRPDERVLAEEVAQAAFQQSARVSTSGRAIKRPAVYQAVASNRNVSMVEQVSGPDSIAASIYLIFYTLPDPADIARQQMVHGTAKCAGVMLYFQPATSRFLLL